MKLRNKEEVIKLQQGGGIPPFVSFTPVPRGVPTNQAITTDKNTDKKDDKSKSNTGLIDKDMLKFMYTQGLQSDTSDLVRKLDYFMSSEFDNLPIDAAVDRYKMLIMELTNLRVGKEQFDTAQKHAIDNEAMDEIAVSQNNTYYILSDKGEIQESVNVLPGEKILTNSELLDLRSRYMPHANNISSIVGQAPSMKTINQKIDHAIKNLNSESITNETFYTSEQKNQIVDGIYNLVHGESGLQPAPIMLGEEGDYKIKEKTESNAKNAQMALSYLYSTLTTREKGLIQAKAQQRGDQSNMGVLKIIQEAIESKVGLTHEVSITGGKTAGSGSGSGASSADAIKMTPTLAYYTGEGGVEGQMIINPRNKNAASIDAVMFHTPTDNNDKPLQFVTANDFINRAFPQVADRRNIYFGEQKVDNHNTEQILVEGEAIANVMLPTDINDPNKPDFRIFDRFTMAQKELKSIRNATQEDWVKVLKKHNLDELLVDGQINQDRFGMFGLVTAIAGTKDKFFFWEDDGAIAVPSTDPMSENRNDFIGKLSERKDISKDTVKMKMAENGIIYNDNLYAGTLFIKLVDSDSAILGAGQRPKVSKEGYTVEEGKRKRAYNKVKKKESNFNKSAISSSMLK